MGEQGKCKFCGESRDLYKPTCQSCKGKLPKYNYKNVYREQGINQGRLSMKEDVEKIIDELKEKDELNWHRINKMPKGSYTIKHVKIEELKQEIAKLQNHSQQNFGHSKCSILSADPRKREEQRNDK